MRVGVNLLRLRGQTIRDIASSSLQIQKYKSLQIQTIKVSELKQSISNTIPDICPFWYTTTLLIKYLNFANVDTFKKRQCIDYRPQFVFLSYGSLFAIRNTAVQENFKRKVLVCIHGNQIIIVQRPSSIDISICHQNNKLTIAGLKRSPFYNDSFLCFCLDDTLKKNYFLLDIARPNHPPLLCTILTIFLHF